MPKPVHENKLTDFYNKTSEYKPFPHCDPPSKGESEIHLEEDNTPNQQDISKNKNKFATKFVQMNLKHKRTASRAYIGELRENSC